MTRTAAREIAILLGFSATAANGGETAQESMDRFFEPEHYASMAEENPLFSEYPDAQQMDYIRTIHEFKDRIFHIQCFQTGADFAVARINIGVLQNTFPQ